MDQKELPLGLSMALAQNPPAMEKFTGLSEDEKQKIINGTHAVNSKTEMKKYVADILKNY